jgi:hypothetical protein
MMDRGPIRMTELAAHERVRTPTTTIAIRRLEKLGLVKGLGTRPTFALCSSTSHRATWPCSENRWPADAPPWRRWLADSAKTTWTPLSKAIAPLDRLAGQSTD